MPDPQSTVGILTSQFFQMRQVEDERDFMLEFIENSNRLRNRFVHIWDEVLDNYLVTFPNEPELFPRNIGPLGEVPTQHLPRSRLKDPETHQIIETLAGQSLGLLIGSREYLIADPIGIDDTEKSRFLSRLIMAVLEQPGMYGTIYRLFKDMWTFGTAILEAGWEKRDRMQMVLEPAFDQFGFVIGDRPVPRRVVYKNQPLIRQVDIYDFYPDPSGTRIQEDMKFVAKRFRITKADARDMAKKGYYNAQAVERAIDAGRDSPENKSRWPGDIRFRDQELHPPDQYGSMIGFEGWGEVPFSTTDNFNNRVITIINGENVRGRGNPFIDGSKPFKEFLINPITGRFYGLGVAEVNRFLQDATDNLLMVFNDVADAAVTAPLLVGQAFGGDPNRLKRRMPLDIIPCKDPSAVKPLIQDFGVLQFAAAELLRRKITMREAAGATDPTQGFGSSKRQTAFETAEIVRFASARTEIAVQLTEREDYPWLGKVIHSRLRQYVPDEGMIAQLAGENFPFKLRDIDFESDFRFVGSRHVQSRFQKATALSQAINILGTNPQILSIIPELVIEMLRDGLDIDNAETWVNLARQRFAQIQGAQVAANQQLPGGRSASNQGSPSGPSGVQAFG